MTSAMDSSLEGKLKEGLRGSDRAIAVIGTKSCTSPYQAMIVKALAGIFRNSNEPFLIIRKAAVDESYEPLTEDQKDIWRVLQQSGEVPEFAYSWIDCNKIQTVEDAILNRAANIVQDWSHYKRKHLKKTQKLIPDHRIIFAIGNDSWNYDDCFKSARELANRVILAIDERHPKEILLVQRQMEELDESERHKFIIVLWNTKKSKSLARHYSAHDFISEVDNRVAGG